MTNFSCYFLQLLSNLRDEFDEEEDVEIHYEQHHQASGPQSRFGTLNLLQGAPRHLRPSFEPVK